MTEARGKQNQSVMGQQPHIGPVQVSLKLDLPGRSLLGRKWETGQQSQQRQQRHRDHSPSTDRCMCALSCHRYKTACQCCTGKLVGCVSCQVLVLLHETNLETASEGLAAVN